MRSMTHLLCYPAIVSVRTASTRRQIGANHTHSPAARPRRQRLTLAFATRVADTERDGPPAHPGDGSHVLEQFVRPPDRARAPGRPGRRPHDLGLLRPPA